MVLAPYSICYWFSLRKIRKIIIQRIKLGNLGFAHNITDLVMQQIDTFISITKVIIVCLFLSMPHIFGFLFFIQPAQGKLHNIVSLIYKFKCMYTIILQYHVHNPYPYHYQRDARKMVRLRSNRKKNKEDMEKKRILLKS